MEQLGLGVHPWPLVLLRLRGALAPDPALARIHSRALLCDAFAAAASLVPQPLPLSPQLSSPRAAPASATLTCLGTPCVAVLLPMPVQK